MKLIKRNLISVLAPLLAAALAAAFQGKASFAADDAKTAPIAGPTSTRTDTDKDKERNFYEVLGDVLGDFEYDIKNGEVNGLKDLAIRNIATSENIPPSFKSHLELLITEKILANSRTRVIQCLPCKSKRTTLNGDQVVITSPDTNPAELSRIAKAMNIQHFLDVAFAYQPSGIVLSMYITEPDSSSILWSRSYNSETSRASAFRRGVDYSQTDDARRMTEYVPLIQHRIFLNFMFEPNVTNGPTTVLAIGYGMMERYDNRKKEVGFIAEYLVNPVSIFSTVGIPAANLWTGFTFNADLLFQHAWNFIGEEENFNKIRGSLAAAVGGTFASGYLGGLIRVTYEWRMAKHWAVQGILGYRPPAVVFFGGANAGNLTGLEYGLGINFLF